jgi:hypothetical protein
MEYSLIIEPTVRIELIEAIEFYSTVSTELGEALLKSFYNEVENILLNPYLHPAIA